MNEVVHVVVWSGGYDSTLILDRLCSSRDKNVWAFAVDWDMVDELKRKQEKTARERYREYAKTKGYTFSYQTVTVSADMSAGDLGLPQALAWVNYVAPYLPERAKVYFGYHRGDDFWAFSHLAKRILRIVALFGERRVQPVYPLKLLSKREIIHEFRQRGIPDSCAWSCEEPKLTLEGLVTPCGFCAPCLCKKLAELEEGLLADKPEATA